MKLESIYAQNKEEPSNPEVLVQGVGRYSLNNVKENVRGKLEDMAGRVADAETADDWKQIQWMLKHGAMHAMVEAIIAAQEELEK